MEQDIHPPPITSSDSSLRGTDTYSEYSVMQELHRGVTFADDPFTVPSQFHPLPPAFLFISVPFSIGALAIGGRLKKNQVGVASYCLACNRVVVLLIKNARARLLEIQASFLVPQTRSLAQLNGMVVIMRALPLFSVGSRLLCFPCDEGNACA